MRLTAKEKKSIKKTIAKVDAQAKVYLFGSRVDDSKKGGDIDLFIYSKNIDRKIKRQIKINLYKEIGEQKIDIIVSDSMDKPFFKLISKDGLLL